MGASQIIIGSAAFRDGELNLHFLRNSLKTDPQANHHCVGHRQGKDHDSRMA